MTTIGAALMAWYGSENRFFLYSLSLFLCYWGVFLALLIITLYIVMLDIRFIHLQYTIGKRELFRQTLGDESFRKELIEAQQRDARNGRAGAAKRKPPT
jgi:hypothetical protein